MFRNFTTCLVVSALSSALFAQDDYQPKVAGASAEGAQAMSTFVLPEGMKVSLLAAEPNVANPVAFHITGDGRVFMCETFRQEVGVEDNRSHMNWLDNDLQLQTVEERLAMFRRYLGHDVHNYAKEHDRIRVLRDSNGDGTLDEATIFATGFNDILDGTGAGVLEHRGKVYYTCIPKLWSMQDTDGDGKADIFDDLHHGYGIRVAFRGHDLHGLTMGPDGRLYFSLGDRGYNVVTHEGKRLKRPDCGAVFRCDLDGSHLEVFAWGLRNPQELVFDNSGNLFTVDNNSDSGDQARLTYIVKDSDTGWRMYYQYLPDRGPWNRERMWHPHRADAETIAVQPTWSLPPLANISDGPSGFTFYPGLGLDDRYQDHFFLADFRGASANSGIRSFAVESTGAGFRPVDSHKFIWSILATDIDFAPDGSLYASDWVHGWVGEGKGRLYRFEDEDQISAVRGAGVPELLSGGVADAGTKDLVKLLSHVDRRVRQAARFELADRPDGMAEFIKGLNATDALTARHAAWGLWQLGLKSPENGVEATIALSQQLMTATEQASQAARILADLMERHGRAKLLKEHQRDALRASLTGHLVGRDLRLAGFSAALMGRIGTSVDVPALLALLSRNQDQDAIVRHQCIDALSLIGSRIPGSLEGAAQHRNPAVRRALAVAFGRMEDTQRLVEMLDDQDEQVVLSAVRMLTDERSVADRDVAALIQRSHKSPALNRRIMEAAYRTGSALSAAGVARLAGDPQQSEELRVLACELLKSWESPQQTNTVTGRWRELPQREVDNLDSAVRESLPAMLAGPDNVRQLTIEIGAQLRLQEIVPELKTTLASESAGDGARVTAFRALADLTNQLDDLLKQGISDRSEEVRLVALELLSNQNPNKAVPLLQEVAQSGKVTSRQQAVTLLGRVRSDSSNAALSSVFDLMEQDKLPAGVILELLEAGSASESLSGRVAAFRAVQQQAKSKAEQWSECLEGGDVQSGRKIFFGRAAASCRRCHIVNGSGASVGPDLSGVAIKNDRHYLLESIVDPNAKIAKGFETTVIVDSNGKIHSGIIREETDEVVRLVTPRGEIVTIRVDEIDDRAPGLSGMPADITKGLTRREVRDLVAFLATLKSAKAGSHGAEGK